MKSQRANPPQKWKCLVSLSFTYRFAKDELLICGKENQYKALVAEVDEVSQEWNKVWTEACEVT